jgi:hypothetical protein
MCPRISSAGPHGRLLGAPPVRGRDLVGLDLPCGDLLGEQGLEAVVELDLHVREGLLGDAPVADHAVEHRGLREQPRVPRAGHALTPL